MVHRQPQAETIVQRYRTSCERGETPHMAAMAHVFCDVHAQALAGDPFQVAMVGSIWLAYLYTRSVLGIAVIAAVVYLVDAALFVAVRKSLRKTSAAVHRHYARSRANMFDPVVYGAALFSVWFALEATEFGAAVPRDTVGDRSVALSVLPLLPLLFLSGWRTQFGVAMFICVLLVSVVFVCDFYSTDGLPRKQAAVATGIRSVSLVALLALVYATRIDVHFSLNSAAACALLCLGSYSVTLASA